MIVTKDAPSELLPLTLNEVSVIVNLPFQLSIASLPASITPPLIVKAPLLLMPVPDLEILPPLIVKMPLLAILPAPEIVPSPLVSLIVRLPDVVIQNAVLSLAMLCPLRFKFKFFSNLINDDKLTSLMRVIVSPLDAALTASARVEYFVLPIIASYFGVTI